MSNSSSFWPILFGVLVSGLALWVTTSRIHERSLHDKWYQNLDMDINNVEDALRLNGGTTAALVDQPGVLMKYGLALFYRWKHADGEIPAAALTGFMQRTDPIVEMPAYIGVGRSYSRSLVVLVVLGAAAFIWIVSNRWDWALMSIPLFSAAGGLYFHGLLVRPELLCLAFGCFGAFGFGALFFRANSIFIKHACLLAAGVMLGVSYLTKLTGLLYILILIGAFSLAWLKSDRGAPHGVSFGKSTKWKWWGAGLLPLVAVGGVFLLSFLAFNPIAAVALERLRIACAIVAALSVVSLIPSSGKRSWLHLLRVVASLLAGTIASFLLTYMMLRLILPEQDSLEYGSRILTTTLLPSDTIKAYASNSSFLKEFVRFLAYDSWMLIIGAVLWFWSVLHLERKSPLHLAFIALWGASLGMMILMSKRYFIAQYVVFVELPLLASIALSIGVVMDRWVVTRRAWVMTALGGGIIWISLFTHGQMNSLYANYQGSAFDNGEYRALFIYNHGFHSPEWKQGLEKHYPDNIQARIDSFLADPRNQYAP